MYCGKYTEDMRTSNAIKKFWKGVIDGLFVGNGEVIMMIKNEWLEKFISILEEQLGSLEWWKKIAEALGTSVWELFAGDAYERWKSLAELWLITTGAGAVGSLAKYAGKTAIWTSVKVWRETVIRNATSKTLYGVGRTTEVVGEWLQLPAKWVKKVVTETGKAIWVVSEKTGLSPTLRSGARVGNEVYERSGAKKVVEWTKNAIGVAIRWLAAVHIVWSTDRNWPKTLISQRGSINLGWKSPHTESTPEGIKNTTNEPIAQEKPPEKSISPERLTESEAMYNLYPELKKHKEFLWLLQDGDIMGQGINAIVVRHPKKPDTVVKIAKEWKVDDLWKEYDTIQEFYIALEKGKEKYKWQLSENVLIPKVSEHPKNTGWYFLMEKIEWQNLNTAFYREYYAEQLWKKYTKEQLDTFTDAQFEIVMKENWLYKVSPFTLAENDWEGRLLRSAMQKFYMKQLDNTDLWNTLWFLEWSGFNHNDFRSNPWNIMVDKKKKVYIIDFWKSEIDNTTH